MGLLQEVVFVIQGRLAVQAATGGFLFGERPDVGSDGKEVPSSQEEEIEAGAWFGEDCLFEHNCVRSSTIVAVAESELAVLNACEYKRIVQKYPRILEKHQSI